MKRRNVLVLSGAVALSALVPVWAQRTVDRSSTPESLSRNLVLDLKEARTLLDRVLVDRGPRGSSREREGSRELDADKRRLTDLLERAERTSRDLEDALRSPRGDRFPLPPRGGGFERPTLTDYQFNDVILAVRKARSAGEERRIVQEFARTSYLTTKQLRVLIPVLDQPSVQEDGAVVLYPKLVDPDRFYTIRDVFKSSSSWDTVIKRLGMR